MLKQYKNKGVTLIELMVSVSLGLILIFSMLAYYSVSQNNLIAHNIANKEQQQLRILMSLLAKDVENTGAFECASDDDIFKSESGLNRFPTDIISLGNKPNRKQIIFAHPVTEEYYYNSLGIIDIDNSGNYSSFAPLHVLKAGCAQDIETPIYIGTTIFETIPIKDVRKGDGLNASGVTAFVYLASIQSRRNDPTDPNETTPANYNPLIEDGKVLFFSNEQNEDLPFGKNEVTIELGLSAARRNSSIPSNNESNPIENGGWINPFESSGDNYELLVNKNAISGENAKLLNALLHANETAEDGGQDMETYPLKPDILERVRAVKFTFKLGDGRELVRVIRFKNAHLMELGDEPEDDEGTTP